MGEVMIEGGYYIKARQIQESTIAQCPPYVREIWDWLIKEANHEDNKYRGFEVKRGQMFRTYKDIQEGLSWRIGWRKMSYHENQVKRAMKFLREELMIDTQKALGGVLITVVNYDKYQNPKHYERTKESTEDRTIEALGKHQPLPDNNKNEKNKKNLKKEIIIARTQESSPSEVAREFFSGGTTYQKMRQLFSERIPPHLVDREFNKFCSYWTEPNKSGSRVRWEQQSTFEIRRRLITWFSRASGQQGAPKNKYQPAEVNAPKNI